MRGNALNAEGAGGLGMPASTLVRVPCGCRSLGEAKAWMEGSGEVADGGGMRVGGELSSDGTKRSGKVPFSFLSPFEKKYCRGERMESRRDGGAWPSASFGFVDCLGCVDCLRRDRFSELF